MSNRRRPQRTPRTRSAWGPPSRAVQSSAAQTGSNQAIAEFYKAVTQKNWQVQNDYRDANLSRINDNRDYRHAVDLMQQRAEISAQTDRRRQRQALALIDARANGGGASGSILGGWKKDEFLGGMFSEDPVVQHRAAVGASKINVSSGVSTAAESDKATGTDYSGGSWWDKINHAANTFNTAIGHGITGGASAAEDAITFGHSDEVNQVASAVGKSQVAQRIKHSAAWGLDKLFRPLYGANTAVQYIMNQDEESGSWTDHFNNPDPGNPIGAAGAFAAKMFTGGLAGQSIFESADDLNLGDIGGTLHAFGQGLSGHKKTMFQDVIASNARRNPHQNVFDNPKYQVAAGLIGDVVTDPLTYVGVGFLKEVPTGAKTLAKMVESEKHLKGRVWANALEANKLGVKRIGPVTAAEHAAGLETPMLHTQEIFSLLGGHAPRAASKAERIGISNAVRRDTNYVATHLGEGPKPRRIRAMERLGKIYQEERKAAVDDFETKAVMDAYRKELEIDVEAGRRPESALESIPEAANHAQVRRAIVNQRMLELGKGDKSFNDTLGEHWLNDPRFTEEERASIVKDAMKYGKQEDILGIRKVTDSIDVLNGQRRGFQKVIADAKRTKGDKWEQTVKQAEGSIRGIEQKLKPLYMKKDNIHASLVINLARTKIKQGGDFALGNMTYKDLNAAKDAQARLSSAYRQLTDMGEELNLPTTLDWNPERILNEVLSKEERNYKPSKSGGNTNASNAGADTGTFSTADDLRQQILDAGFELHNLKTKFNSFTDRSLEVPSYFKSGNRVDTEGIKKHIDFSYENNTFSFKPTGDESVDNFLKQLMPELNADYVLAEKTIRENFRRGVNEVDQHGRTFQDLMAKAEKGDKHANKLLEMFAPHGERGVPTPYVTVKGVKVFRGTNASEKALRDAKIITQKDVARAHDLEQKIKRPSELTVADARVIRGRLEDAGVFVPPGLKNVSEFIAKNQRLVQSHLNVKDFVFAREFKKQHGMTPYEARNAMDKVRGRVVKLSNGEWARRHPEGLTEGEFVQGALKSKDDLYDTVVGGPVPLRVFDAGNEILKTTLAQQKKLMREAGATRAELGKREQQWTSAMWRHLEHIGPLEAQAMLKKTWQFTHNEAKSATEKTAERSAQQASKTNLTPAENAQIAKDARKQTVNTLMADIQNGHAVGAYKDTLPFMRPMSDLSMSSSENELFDALTHKFGMEHANLVAERAGAFRRGDKVAVSEVDGRIDALKTARKYELQHLDRISHEAKEARKVFQTRLVEDSIFKVINAKLVNQGRALNMNVWGHQLFKVPGSEAMFKAVEQFSDLPVISQTRQAYANALVSPASRLPAEGSLMMSRYKANTAEIIGDHVKRLDADLGKYPDAERAREFEKWKNGIKSDHELHPVLDAEFNRLIPYFRGDVKIGDSHLLASEIIHRLPDEIKVDESIYKNLHGMDTPQKLANYFRSQKIGKDGEIVNTPADPIHVLWTTNIAAEQAIGTKALHYSINDTFGIKRAGKIDNKTGRVIARSSTVDDETRHAIEQLGTKAGWKTIKELGQTHFFPPESVGDIQRMLNMTKPRNVTEVGKLIDDATGIWKVGATLYNPGYYTRNGVGEVMAAWFGGVNDVKYYKRSMKMTRYNRNDGKELEALKSHYPALDHVQSDMVKGSEHVATLRTGQKITVERAHVLYHDQGLRTGFLNTEFGKRSSNQTLKQKPGIKQLVNKHHQIQQVGEGYEDYFRMAHFLHALEHAPVKTEAGAAKYAAEQVRKYHFDYTDFTNIEKAVMLRAFPFYKWSRKALPLMSTMMFTKPGKVTSYMKTANAMSNMNKVSQTTISTGDMTDPNGYFPDYQGIVPGWMQDMWAYQLTGDPGNEMGSGSQTFGNLATPAMDVMKTMNDPANSAWALTNPVFKVPVEAAAQQTFGNMPMKMDGNTTLTPGQQQGDHLARALPLGSFLDKMVRGKAGKHEVASFLTGLGDYQNTDARRQGELARRTDNAQ